MDELESYEVRERQRMKKKAIRTGAAIGAGVIGVVFLFILLMGLPIGYAARDHIYLVYANGPIDDRNFIKVVQPGDGLYWKGFFNDSFGYPVTRRNYIVSKKADEGDVKGEDLFRIQASDGNTVEVQASVYFQLPVNDQNFLALLQEFHEQIGYKNKAWTEDGWKQMLAEFVRQPMRGALQEVSANITPVEAAGSKKLEIRDSVRSSLQDRVDRVMGGHYINVSEFELIEVYPGDEINGALQRVVQSQQGILAAENDRQAGLKIAEKNRAIRESLQGAGGIEAVLQNAVEKGEIKLWVIPQGSSLTIPQPQQ